MVVQLLDSGWPLTWKTWKSQGIPKWPGKGQGNWNLLELKFQLLAACGPGLSICSSLTLL